VLQQALYASGEILKSSVPAVAVPVKVKRYADEPRALLNPVRVPPRKPKRTGGGRAGTVEQDIETLLSPHVERDIDALINGTP
jgi:hypothetical protein